jgi:cytidylate kinase
MKRVITIGGLHGTGKSSVALAVAKRFNLRRVSAGSTFRRLAQERGLTLEEFCRVAESEEEIDKLIDEAQREEAKRGDVVIDGQLAGWMAGEYADLKIYLIAPLEARIKRIAARDGTEFEFAKRETIHREGSEKARYLEYYKVDVADLSIYDLILNTGKYSLDGVSKIVITSIETYYDLQSP